jgi:flagellar biosynthesis/type III secretory pathway M-ring protein FliF/YscJ
MTYLSSFWIFILFLILPFNTKANSSSSFTPSIFSFPSDRQRAKESELSLFLKESILKFNGVKDVKININLKKEGIWAAGEPNKTHGVILIWALNPSSELKSKVKKLTLAAGLESVSLLFYKLKPTKEAQILNKKQIKPYNNDINHDKIILAAILAVCMLLGIIIIVLEIKIIKLKQRLKVAKQIADKTDN